MKEKQFEKKAYRLSLIMYYGVFALVLLCACVGYTLQTHTQPIETIRFKIVEQLPSQILTNMKARLQLTRFGKLLQVKI